MSNLTNLKITTVTDQLTLWLYSIAAVYCSNIGVAIRSIADFMLLDNEPLVYKNRLLLLLKQFALMWENCTNIL